MIEAFVTALVLAVPHTPDGFAVPPPVQAPAEPRTPEPAPTPTQPSRDGERPPPAPANVTLACIRDHESGGSYTVVNEYGFAGAYQLHPDYKDDWARRYGYPQWADVPVPQWPPAVQDAVALALGQDTNWWPWKDPRWSTYTCPGFWE